MLVIGGAVVAAGVLLRHPGSSQNDQYQIVDCRNGRETDFKCWQQRYEALVMNESTKAAFEDVRTAYAEVPYIYSNCHQIAHVIGRTAGKRYGDIAEAYNHGDNFCWSGYYHGVVEAVAAQLGPNGLVERINEVCAAAKEREEFSFYHYNCVHGVGHGLMATQNNDLFKSLSDCDKLEGSWQQESCYGGVFMENVMSEVNPDHHTEYLKDDEPLYPCTAVDERYKGQCYLMQTSHALQLVDYDFASVFELCMDVETPYDATCFQSLGRDASGSTTSDVSRTKELCLIGTSELARENCIIGAVKDFISYYHDDQKAKELCGSFNDSRLTSLCTGTAEEYYRTF